MCLLSDETSQRTLNIMKDKSIIQIGGYFSWDNNRKRAQVRRRPQQKRRSKRICPVSSFIAIIVSRARKFSGAQFLKTISKIRKTKRKLWSCVDGHHQKKKREKFGNFKLQSQVLATVTTSSLVRVESGETFGGGPTGKNGAPFFL